MARCPGDVPWWRVVHADGRMKGTPGADEQRARLAEEGVTLTGDGRVAGRLGPGRGSVVALSDSGEHPTFPRAA
jgi:hypothetical protein